MNDDLKALSASHKPVDLAASYAILNHATNGEI